jgi:glycosyltransferase involved in cell wall biosynthesis
VSINLPRQDVVALFHAADLFLLPSNIECAPLVLYEAMAGGTPWMSTDVGNAAEIARATGAGVILPTMFDKEGFSHAIIGPSAQILESLYKDQQWLNSKGQWGYAAWTHYYTWDIIAGQYERLYERLLS